MILFNEVSDEVDGLISEGGPRDSRYRAFGHRSFDRWNQNQLVAGEFSDGGRSRAAGLRVWDRPTGAPLGERFALAEQVQATPRGPARDSRNCARFRARDRVAGNPRLHLGSRDGNATVGVRNPEGRVRFQLSVNSLGVPRMLFSNTLGRRAAAYP